MPKDKGENQKRGAHAGQGISRHGDHVGPPHQVERQGSQERPDHPRVEHDHAALEQESPSRQEEGCREAERQ